MRLKDVVDLINAKTDCVDRPYIALENIVSWDAKFVASDAATEGTNACFKAGDVLFGKLRPYLAKGYLPDYDGICSTEFLVMRPHDDMNGRYLLYWLLSPEFISVIKNRVAGVKMPRTDWATVSQMELTPPTLTEQRRIVAYLDKQTAAIDSRVAVLERKLAAYKRLKASVINRAVTRGLDPKAKLKDSGVDWIGQIPAGWEVGRVKDVAIIGNGSDPKTEGDIPVYGSGEGAFKTCGEFKEGPVVLIGRKGALHIPHYVEGRYWNVDTAFDVRVSSENSLRWFYYQALRFEYRYYMSQTTLPSMTQSDYQNMVIGIPSSTEQRAIADYLDAECAKIDKMAELVTREIELYKKLKRSLINEVVTGKRLVS